MNKQILLNDFILPFLITFWFLLKNLKFFNHTHHTQHLKNYQNLILFLITTTISLLISSLEFTVSETFESTLYLIRLISFAFLYPITIDFLSITKNPKTLTNLIGINAIILSILGFIQLKIYPNLFELARDFGYDPHINRLVSTWLDPNFLGGFLSFTICIFIGIALSELKSQNWKSIKYLKSNLFNLLTIFISTLALLLTYSRSSLLALISGIFIIGIFRAKKILITFIILITIFIFNSERSLQRTLELFTSISSTFNLTTTENPDPTARLRIENYNQTLELIKEKPLLGHGYNTLKFIKYNRGYIKDLENHAASGTDSSLLTILTTTGLIGLITFLNFILTPILTLFHQSKSQNSTLNPISKNLTLTGTKLNLNKTLSSKKLTFLTAHIKKYFQTPIPQPNQNTKPNPTIQLSIMAALISLLIHSNFVNSLLFPQILTFFFPILTKSIHQTTNTNPQF